MIKDKTYRYDDAFKAWARKHQFDFKEFVLNDFYNDKNPQVILSPTAAQRGLIFCDQYRYLIQTKVQSFGTSTLFSNMLRSEHIPYNIFTPMEEDLENTASLFNEIIGGGISYIKQIHIEYAGRPGTDKSEYLNDGTSFDTFIEYEATDGKIGGIGIEVKYTENGYHIGKKEKNDIENPNGKYSLITILSGYYIPTLNITAFIKANHLRQIWRNHILGYSMLNRGDIQHFHHIHLYPQGNTHFHELALPIYKNLLTEKGKQSFIDLTYESLFNKMNRHFITDKQQEWIKYLINRYLSDVK